MVTSLAPTCHSYLGEGALTETEQSENPQKGGVSLHGWCQKGSTFSLPHGAVEPGARCLSPDAGLYGYHSEKEKSKT